MLKYLPISAIRRMEYAELKRWWETDFNTLTTTAVAEAEGGVRPSVAEALRSDDWLEQWADALYCACGELGTSKERFLFNQDQRYPAVRRQYGLVHEKMDYVNSLLRARRVQMNAEVHGPRDIRVMSLNILGRHHCEESRELVQQEFDRRGLAPQQPFHGIEHDPFTLIEDAVRRGTIQAPTTPEVRSLLKMSLADLTHRVAADTAHQDQRCDGLRHPLLLRLWENALVHLRDRHCDLVGLKPEFTVSLPILDMREIWGMDAQEAIEFFNRRRFIRALAQRRRECQSYVRGLKRTVKARNQDIKKPWTEAERAAREALALRHPEHFKALMTALSPLCEPGSTIFREELNPVKMEKRLISLLRQALEDGTWRNLTTAPAVDLTAS